MAAMHSFSKEAAALIALLACLVAAIARPRWRQRWALDPAVAAVCALALVGAGILSGHAAWGAVRDLGPTVAFLAALLALAEGCAREGLFTALGSLMAAGARGD